MQLALIIVSCVLAVAWILGALLTTKLNAACMLIPTDYKGDFIIALLTWWAITPMMIVRKHRINPSKTDDREYAR